MICYIDLGLEVVVLLHDLNARLLGARVATRYDEPDVYSVSRTGVVACRRFVELLGITDERCPAELIDGVLVASLPASNGPDAG